jgi:hypothetical protein
MSNLKIINDILSIKYPKLKPFFFTLLPSKNTLTLAYTSATPTKDGTGLIFVNIPYKTKHLNYCSQEVILEWLNKEVKPVIDKEMAILEFNQDLKGLLNE